jgi:hypothetical protein
MLVHPVDPSYTLVEVADLQRDPLPEEVRADAGTLRTVLAWAHEYLCAPHPDLGRPGNVCPYTQGALDRGTFYLTVAHGADPDPDVIEQRMHVYRDWFLDLSGPTGSARMFHTILMLFPDLPADRAPRIIDELQQRLVAAYVPLGLMVGEFHDGPPDKPGLWNPLFRPLRGPVPLLGIRHMVATDYLFLESDPEHVKTYLRLYGDQIPAHLRERVLGGTSR